MFLSTHLAQYALYAAFPQLTALTLFLPIYLVGFPLFLLTNWLFTKINRSAVDNHATIDHATDNHAAVDHAAANHAALDHAAVHCADSRSCRKALPLGRFLLLFPVCFFAMYSGNLLGLLLQGIMRIAIPFSLPLPATAALAVEDLPSQAFFLVIAAPLMEEFLFRRTVIERLLPYGEKAALITSALLFGLFHGSINQICYAFTLGLVFGYVYLKTRRLRYTVILHMTINGLSSLLLPALLNLVTRSMQGASIYSAQMDSVLATPGVIAILVYLILLLVLSLFGAVLFAFGFRERELSGDSVKLRAALSSAGMLVFLIVSVLWASLT